MPFSDEDAAALTTALEWASKPATPDQIATELMVIISQYFIGSQPKLVRDRTAAIWIKHLEAYPLWAIQDAVAWWIGPENPGSKRGRRPQPGDLAEVCRDMMGPVTRARQHITWWNRYRGAYPDFIARPAARKFA